MATRKFSLRMERENYERLKEIAKRRGVSASRVLNDLLSVVLAKIAGPEISAVWVKMEFNNQHEIKKGE